MPDTGGIISAQTETPGSTFGICRLGDTWIAVPIDALSEVCKIDALSNIPIRSSYLCGGIDLRGQIIPVVNLSQICGIEVPAVSPPYAVVIRRAGQRLAVLVDQVIGISQIDDSRIDVLIPSASSDEHGCVRRMFIDDGHAISVIDVDRFFDLPGVYSVKIRSNTGPASIDDGRIPMLTFMVGNARFAVDATEVYATFPRQSIEVGAMSSGYCIGSITYHQRRVPVIDSVRLLGLGRSEKRTESAVVVLHCSSERLIGLAVDTIQDIRRVDLRRHARPPHAITRRHDFITQVVMQENDIQVFVLSAKNLSSDSGVAAIASLSSAPARTSARLASENRVSSSRFLVVEVGRDFAVPLDQVTSIIPMPAQLVPAAQAGDGLTGFFARPPYSVPLIDLRMLMGRTQESNDLVRVLLVGEGEQQVGFQVERVSSIETSNWVLDGLKNAGSEAETLVQLGTGASRRAATVLDLRALALRFLSGNELPQAENATGAG